jgi:hypothetical protein
MREGAEFADSVVGKVPSKLWRMRRDSREGVL